MTRRDQPKREGPVQHEGRRREAGHHKHRELCCRYRGGKVPGLSPEHEHDDHRQGRRDHPRQLGSDLDRIGAQGATHDAGDVAERLAHDEAESGTFP